MKWLRQRKRKLLLWAVGLAGYVLALVLLTLVERSSPEASIQDLGDAFWYSVVTMSTVGYGDLYPITGLGKVLGICFVLLSVGMLTFVISLMIRLVTGKMLPTLRMWQLRRHTWYLFSRVNPPALALMEGLKKQDPKALFLVPEESGEGNWICCPGSMEQIAEKKKKDCGLFYMDGEYEAALAALETGHGVYCMTSYAPDVCPQGLTLFDREDCCAREYWRSWGVGEQEERLLIIGSGKHAQRLLIRGLLINVLPGRHLHWHMFGNWESFCRSHHRLEQMFSLKGEAPDRDSLSFCPEGWDSAPRLLERADRILICTDDMQENLQILSRLRTWFVTKGNIHLLYGSPIPGETVFGADSQIYTPELVMQQKLTKAARTMNDIYRRGSGGTAPDWAQLSEFHRQSNLATADHLLTKIRLLLGQPGITGITAENCAAAYARWCALPEEEKQACRKLEHDRWMVFHCLYNWRYDPVRNNAARLHPLLLRFEELSSREQEKDDYAWQMLQELAESL